jgi:lariat debranching enzyme
VSDAAGAPPARFLRVGVVGCSHGALDEIYAAVVDAGSRAVDGRGVDLLLCCGDFQAVRNPADLACMACPDKYKSMQSFWRYYSGAAVAPVPTLFIGGNHEATNHCAEMPFGGWAAPNIYYLGTAGVVNFGGLRIGGVSGIFKSHDFSTGAHERAPYTARGALHSANHQRAFDFWRLATLAAAPPPRVDVMLSHDWPEGVYHFGDAAALLAQKPFFRDDMAAGALGSPPAMALLRALAPRFWFSGHLHCKFAALVPHAAAPPTRFLALDKPGARRAFLQVLDIPVDDAGAARDTPLAFHFDVAWMAVAVAAHTLTPAGRAAPPLAPAPLPSIDTVSHVAAALARAAARARGASDDDAAAAARAAADAPFTPIRIPANFVPSASPWDGSSDFRAARAPAQGGNPQTDALFAELGLAHITTVPCGGCGSGGGRGGGRGGGGGGGAGAGGWVGETSSGAVAAAGAPAAGAALQEMASAQRSAAPTIARDVNEIDISDF